MLERLRQGLASRLVGKAARTEQLESVIEALIKKNEPPKRGSRELAIAYRTTPWLHSVASRVSSSFAAVDWNVQVAVNKSSGKAYRSIKLQRANFERRVKLLHWFKQRGELSEIEDHPLLTLLHTGNRVLPGKACMEITCLHLDIIGEAFWVLERNALGVPVEFWPTPPWWVKKTPTQQLDAFTVEVNGQRKDLPPDDVIWFRNPDPENPYGRGTGVAEALGDEIDTDEYASKYIKTFFFNQALPSAIVSMIGAGDKEIAAAKEVWLAKYRGHWNANKVSFVNREVKINKLENSFKDQQVIGLREHERDCIQQVWGVPPEIIGIITNSNRATIDAAIYIMALYVTVPRLERVRDVVQQRLAPQFDERIIVGFESPVPEDREFWLKVASANRGAMTRGEWREAMDLDSHGPIDDVYVMALGEVERRLYGDQRPQEIAPPEASPKTPLSEEPASPEEPEQEEPTKGYLAPRHKTRVNTADIEEILKSLRPERLTVPMDAVFQRNIEKWGAAKLAEIVGVGARFDMLNPLVVEHLQHLATNQIGGLVDETTREALRDTLAEGVRAGEPIELLASRVGETFVDAEGYRSIVIARTEVLHSSNFATFTAYDITGMVEQKQWVATPDDRTREEHLALNGQVRPLHEPFEVGGARAMYPGDFGVAALDIQCRCTHVAIIGEPRSLSELDMVWKAYDRDLVPWEDEATDALRKGFSRQRDDVMVALRSIAQ